MDSIDTFLSKPEKPLSEFALFAKHSNRARDRTFLSDEKLKIFDRIEELREDEKNKLEQLESLGFSMDPLAENSTICSLS